LLGVLVVIEVLGLPVLVVLYLAERGRVAQRLNALTQELARLRSAMAAPGAPEPARPTAPMPGEAAPSQAQLPAAPAKPAAAAAPPGRVLAAASDWAITKSSPAAPAPAAPRESLEERVMRRWAVWLGGIALAFGAYFLVKFSIEQGWFGPAARVAAGIALGLSLWALSEWVRQRDLRSPLPGGAPDAIPPALAA